MKDFIKGAKANWRWINTALVIMGISLISTSFITWNCLDAFAKGILFVFGLIYLIFSVADAIPEPDSEI